MENNYYVINVKGKIYRGTIDTILFNVFRKKLNKKGEHQLSRTKAYQFGHFFANRLNIVEYPDIINVTDTSYIHFIDVYRYLLCKRYDNVTNQEIFDNMECECNEDELCDKCAIEQACDDGYDIEDICFICCQPKSYCTCDKNKNTNDKIEKILDSINFSILRNDEKIHEKDIIEGKFESILSNYLNINLDKEGNNKLSKDDAWMLAGLFSGVSFLHHNGKVYSLMSMDELMKLEDKYILIEKNRLFDEIYKYLNGKSYNKGE